jgi:hypothetical protein
MMSMTLTLLVFQQQLQVKKLSSSRPGSASNVKHAHDEMRCLMISCMCTSCMHAYTHILKNQFWVCSNFIESCPKFLIPFSEMCYPGSPQQKAAAEVHHVSKAQQPRERCIRSMIPLRTKCSATRPRPAPRANSMEVIRALPDQIS